MFYISYGMNAMNDLKLLSQLLILWAFLYSSPYHHDMVSAKEICAVFLPFLFDFSSVIQHYPLIIHNSNSGSIYPGAVLAQKFWEGIASSAPFITEYMFSETEKYERHNRLTF